MAAGSHCWRDFIFLLDVWLKQYGCSIAGRTQNCVQLECSACRRLSVYTCLPWSRRLSVYTCFTMETLMENISKIMNSNFSEFIICRFWIHLKAINTANARVLFTKISSTWVAAVLVLEIFKLPKLILIRSHRLSNHCCKGKIHRYPHHINLIWFYYDSILLWSIYL